jgi:hypothetical protein
MAAKSVTRIDLVIGSITSMCQMKDERASLCLHPIWHGKCGKSTSSMSALFWKGKIDVKSRDEGRE